MCQMSFRSIPPDERILVKTLLERERGQGGMTLEEFDRVFAEAKIVPIGSELNGQTC